MAAGFALLVSVPSSLGLDSLAVRLDAVLVLVSVGFVAILGVGAWIGYTMATTPPPSPLKKVAPEDASKTEEAPPT